MPRTARPRFLCQPLEELDRQLHFTPPDKREEQLRLAERLHDEIDPEINYPFDYIAYRITRYRRDSGETTLLVGSALLPDLRQIIDTLSRSIEIPFDDEPTETPAQLARRLNVSTKTISRWRKIGLRWRWIVTTDGKKRKQIGITRRAMEHFTSRHPDRVDRAQHFTQMTEAARHKLIEEARALAENESLSLNQVAQRLAEKTGRALETIRLLLQKHDRKEPDNAIFTDHLGPLTDRQNRVIARAHRMGIAIDKLCDRFGRTRSTIYRAIHERRAEQAMLVELTWIDSPQFHREDTPPELPPETPPDTPPKSLLKVPQEGNDGQADHRPAKVSVDDLPPPLQTLYRPPPVSAQRMREMFLRYNYLKFKAATVREGFDEYEVRATDLDQFDSCVARARRLRSSLARAGLPTLLSVARRHLIGEDGKSLNRLLSLLEIGFEELIETVEHYDAGRNHQFDAVLTNRLLRCFATHADDDDPHPRRAQRRLTDTSAVGRMNRLASQHGIDLGLEPGDADDRV